MEAILEDIVDRNKSGYTYLGTYEQWASPPLGIVFEGLICPNENGYPSLTFADVHNRTYEFYNPGIMGYDIKDHLDYFTLPEYTTSVFFVRVENIMYRCNVVGWAVPIRKHNPEELAHHVTTLASELKLRGVELSFNQSNDDSDILLDWEGSDIHCHILAEPINDPRELFMIIYSDAGEAKIKYFSDVRGAADHLAPLLLTSEERDFVTRKSSK